MKLLKYILLLTFLIPFIGCEKDSFNNTEERVGISRVTFFADVTLEGPEIMSVVKGSTFTDPGATATEKGETIPVTVNGAVNTNEVGLYTLEYTATNKDGFAQGVSRTVFVIPSTEAPNSDMSGTYSQVGADNTATATRVSEGVYFMDNMNHPSTPISAYFISTDGVNIIWPNQATPYGDMSGSGTYDAAAKTAVWTISIPSQAYTRTRTFQKQ